MTLYFAGHGLDSYRLTPTPPNDAGGGGIGWPGGVPGIFAYADLLDPSTGAPAAPTTVWTHGSYGTNYGDFNTVNQVFVWYNSSGVPVFMAVGDNANGLAFSYWNGSAFVSVGDSGGVNNGGTFDFYFNIAVSGEVSIFFNGVRIIHAVGIDTSGMVNIASFRVGPGNHGGVDYYNFGQCIIASFSTISHQVFYRRPSGNGPEQGWTGDYTDIDTGDINDATTINTNITNAVSTFTGPDFSAVPVGSIIKGISIGARTRHAGSPAPENIAAVLSIGGTDYLSPDLTIGPGFSGSVGIFELDPSTSLPWANLANINGHAFGVKALA